MMNIIIGMLAWQAICFLVGCFITDEEKYILFTIGIFTILLVPIACIKLLQKKVLTNNPKYDILKSKIRS